MFSKLKITLCIVVSFLSSVQAQDKKASEKFPVPAGIKNMLFYVQRSLNTNTIIYELNMNDAGELNTDEPIKYYYINYAHHSEVEPVSDIQKKYAYGIVVKTIDKEKLSYSFSFNSFKDRTLYLLQSPKDKTFHVSCYINGKLCILNKVFVTMEKNFIGLPRVDEIELFGTDITKHEDISEQFKP